MVRGGRREGKEGGEGGKGRREGKEGGEGGRRGRREGKELVRCSSTSIRYTSENFRICLFV